MTTGLKIGKVFGITIRVDWSWLLIFFLIVWNLGVAFGQIHHDWTSIGAWALGVLAALLFFAALLAHELAHSLVARAQGVPVRSITLFLFGGVSNIQRDPPSPLAEFLITIVGPITSLVIGGALLLIAEQTIGPLVTADPFATMGDLSPALTLILWLGSINLLIGVFNLIPGFPLDGGRLLRAGLWQATGDLHRATRWASWVGQATAWLLILAGISMVFGAQIPILGSGLINGLWLTFIGWFLNSAAMQSYRRLVIRDTLEDIPVLRMMQANPLTVPADVPVSELVYDYVMTTDDNAFLVLEDQHLAGLVTLSDVREVPREQWDTTPVRAIMKPAPELDTISADADGATAFQRLMTSNVRQLPVLRDGRLAGLLRRRDIVRWVQLQADINV
jgi:Zn-dependent protease/CBS domain-containing protein